MEGIEKFVGFSAIDFGRTLVVSFQLLLLGLDNCVYAISMRVGDDTMITICFWTTEKGELLHLSYISASQSHSGQSSRQLPVLL